MITSVVGVKELGSYWIAQMLHNELMKERWSEHGNNICGLICHCLVCGRMQ